VAPPVLVRVPDPSGSGPLSVAAASFLDSRLLARRRHDHARSGMRTFVVRWNGLTNRPNRSTDASLTSLAHDFTELDRSV